MPLFQPQYNALTLGGNTAGTTTFQAGNNNTLFFHGGNNITLSGNGNSMTISGANAGGGSPVSLFEPIQFAIASATSTASVSNLHLIPFTPPAISFGNINMVGSLSLPATSGGNSLTFRMGQNQSVSLSNLFSISNQNIIDLFLFSRGSGSFSSELQTFASTRNIIQTNYMGTYFFTAAKTGTNCSRQESYTLAANVSFPDMTSGQVINGASTFTTWGAGSGSWQSTASTQVASATVATNNTFSLSVVSTYPATTEWASNKLIQLQFATSLSAGEYWLGVARATNVTSSTDSARTWGILATDASYTFAYGASAWQNTGQITWMGNTNTLASSLAEIGQNVNASLGPEFGLGSFSGTWDANSTYLNNAGNPNGAVAFSQLRTNVSFFRTWVQFASNRI